MEAGRSLCGPLRRYLHPGSRPGTQALLDWADLIFVMEDRHREQLIQRFGRAAYLDALIVLDIPDVYRYMDPELVAELRDTVTVCLP